jgi:hypothetical protein
VTTQEEKRDGEHDDADQPHNWISGVEHSEHFNLKLNLARSTRMARAVRPGPLKPSR